MAALLILPALALLFFVSRPDFLLQDLNGAFVWMLARSLSFSFFQAMASVFVAAATALSVAFFVVTRRARAQRILFEILRVLGMVLFFAPTLVASLNYLQWSRSLLFLPSFGWVPIVLVHASLNLFFLAYAFAAVMKSELEQNARLVEVSKIYRLSRWSLYFRLWAEPLRAEFYRWLPLVFWWSISSFTTVLVLGGGPRYSTPEVLLFYLVGAADRPARLAMVVVVQLVVGAGALLFVRSRAKKPERLRDREPAILMPEFFWTRSRTEKIMALGGAVAALTGAVFWLPALGRAVLALNFDVGMLAPLATSLSILWRAICVGGFVVAMGLVLPSKWSRTLGISLIVSPMVLIGVAAQSEAFYFITPAQKLWLTAALCVWSSLPVFVLWVLGKRESLNAIFADILAVFAPTRGYRVRAIYLPLLGLPIFCYLQVLVLSVMGDVGIASSVLGASNPALGPSIYAKVSAYQFDAAFSLFGYLVLSVLPLWILLGFVRQKNDLREL